MIKDWKGKEGGWRRVQYCLSPRAQISCMGTPIAQDEPCLHVASDRGTGSTFTLAVSDLTLMITGSPTIYRGMKGKDPVSGGLFQTATDEESIIQATIDATRIMKP